MPERIIAEAFPPGEFIKEELETRGWAQADLAEILGIKESVVSALISAKKTISPVLAKALAAAFGTSAQVWMNLESSYRLFQTHTSNEDVVARKARLYELAPIKELIKRGWIEASSNIAVLEQRVTAFMQTVPHAPRKSTDYATVTPAQQAWLCRAQQLAARIPAAKFTDASLQTGVTKLRELLQEPEAIRQVPHVLREAGIRFLVIEHLPQTRIDGACLWLNNESPVIVISLRYDRLDWFWHTVLHELGHVERRDGLTDAVALDENLVGDKAQPRHEKPEAEQRADQFACDFSITEAELNDFITRVRPFFSRQKITGFAYRLRVHPAIVVGQLQHRGLLPYSHSREMLVRVRDIVTDAALTDGWGHTGPQMPEGANR